MRKPIIVKAVLVDFLFIVLLNGCATRYAPRGWTPQLSEAQTQAYGGWVTVTHLEKDIKISGELIAVEDEMIYVLSDSGIHEVFLKDIKKLQLEVYWEKQRTLGWGILGAISTLSHGWGSIISAPTWIIATVSAVPTEANSGLIVQSRKKMVDLRPFARFPQGFPKDIDLSSLKLKSKDRQKE